MLKAGRAGTFDDVSAPKPQQRKTYKDIVAALPKRESDEERLILYGEKQVIDAIRKGDLARLKELVAAGANIYAHEDFALIFAAVCGHLDVVHYLVKQGADVHANNDKALMWAAQNGHLDVVRYLIEEQGADVHADNDAALRWAAGNGHLHVVRYLVKQGANVHADNDAALIAAYIHGDYHVARCLVVELGADINVMSKEEKREFKNFMRDYNTWKKAARAEPPDIELSVYDPSYFRPVAFAAVSEMIKQEGYSGKEAAVYAFPASGLFGTEDRVLQYLEKWGVAGRQPLHDIIQMIKLPEKKTPEMDLKAWGDAVLRCGPSMAKLVKFADRIPVPAKSADGKSWSMVKTREIASQFCYARAAEHPVLADLCFENDVEEKDFEVALALVKRAPAVKNIPDIAIKGEDFDLPGAAFRRLDKDDVRGLFLGELTDCCQSIGGAGAACAEHGFTSKDSGFYVVENAKGKVIGQTWAWRGEKDELVFDSLETLGGNVSGQQWKKLTEVFAKAVANDPGDITAFNVGTGGATPESLAHAFQAASSPAAPRGHNGYRDSGNQITLWSAAGKKVARPAR